jgi:hypothetical protein
VSRTLRQLLGDLKIPQNRFAALPDKGVPQAEQAALKVHVRPFQAKKLPFSHTSVDVLCT